MDAGDWIATVAAVIALGAMGVAWLQAREAKESRHAAQAQAAAAKDSAEIAEAGVKQAQRSARAAEQQAQAAQSQVEIMRTQLDQALAERNEREGPVFRTEDAVLCEEEVGTFATKVTVTMTSGPPLTHVKAEIHGDYLGRTFRSADTQLAAVFEKVSQGSKFTVYTLHENCPALIHGIVKLTCQEDGGELRSWNRSYGVQFVLPPEPPRPMWAFG